MALRKLNNFNLHPGDILLYGPTGLFGWLISVKTWHPIAHVELYLGNGRSVASRDGIGVNVYDFREPQLAYILRPTTSINLNAALVWFFQEAQYKPYGWWDLLNFIGISCNTRGMFCSEFVTLFLRAGGVPIFNEEEARKVAPFEFLTSELFKTVWKA